VQAAQRVLAVSITNGPTVATDVAFTTATGYQGIDPGVKTLRVQPTGGKETTLQASLTAGSIYSLLVLEAPDGGVTASLLTDAKRSTTAPVAHIRYRGRRPAGGPPARRERRS